MKKILFIILLLLNCFYASPQTEMGVKAGVSLAGLEGNFEQGELSLSNQGPSGGIIVVLKISPSFYIQPEVNFCQQGDKRTGMQHVPGNVISWISFNDPELYADVESTIKLNYVEIPLLAKLVFGHKFKYYVSFGPYIAFCTKASRQITGNSYLYLNSKGTVPFVESEGGIILFLFPTRLISGTISKR